MAQAREESKEVSQIPVFRARSFIFTVYNDVVSGEFDGCVPDRLSAVDNHFFRIVADRWSEKYPSGRFVYQYERCPTTYRVHVQAFIRPIKDGSCSSEGVCSCLGSLKFPSHDRAGQCFNCSLIRKVIRSADTRIVFTTIFCCKPFNSCSFNMKLERSKA